MPTGWSRRQGREERQGRDGRGRSRATLAALLAATLLTLLAACGGGSGRQGADIVVTASGPAGPAAAGASLVMTATVANAGPATATAVPVSHLLSNQLAPVSVTCAASGGAVCPDAPSLITTVPSMPAGSQVVFTVTLQLTPGANGTVSDTVSANYADDVDRSNNSASMQLQAVATVSNLVVGGSGPGGTITGGGTADFAVSVRNEGPDPAATLSFTNNAGSFLVVKPGGVTCSASGGAVCPAALGPLMTLESMPVGGALDFVVSTTVSGSINGAVTNAFQVSAATDAARTDNAVTLSANVVTPRTGVFATGTGPAAPVAGGGTALFAMSVGNAGPDAATDVQIVDDVGSNLTLRAVTCQAAGGAVCPAALGPVMTVPSLPAGGSLAFAVQAQVAAGTTGTLTNTLSVNAANDSDRGDNVATAVATAATPRAALVLSGSGPAAPLAGGATAQFAMSVTNSGPDAATNLRVVNVVGGNLTFTGATCRADAPAVCPANVGVDTAVGTLPAGGRLNFTVSAVVAPGTNGAITNTLQASADNAFSPSGNSVVAVGTAATARSSLVVTGSAPQDVPAGSGAVFTMTVANQDGPGAGPADVRLVHTLGGNLTLSGPITCSVVAGGATCPAATGITATLTGLPVGGSLRFNVPATVAVGTQGSIIHTLTATVTSGTPSAVTGAAVGSAYANSLQLAGEAPAGVLRGGDAADFVMTLTNAGPGPARDVTWTQALGAGLVPRGSPVLLACTDAQCPTAGAATLTIASIAAGGSVRLLVPASVQPGANGALSVASSAQAAGNLRGAGSAVVASATAVSADPGVSQAFASTVTAGSAAVFTATVANPAGVATGALTLTSQVSSDGWTLDPATVQVVCSRSTDADCPRSVGAVTTVPALGPGASLTFTVTVPVPAAARGSLGSRFALQTVGDRNPDNNVSVVTTRIADPRNGTWRAFAADGREYPLVLDFDARTLQLAGAARAFTADGAGNYVVAGAVRFRLADDLVVGAHDLPGAAAANAAGVLPYVAAKTFGSSVAEAAGAYNLMTRTVPAAGAATTRAAVAVITGNQLAVCDADLGAVLPPGARCPGARQRNYLLAVAGGVYSAVEAAPTGGAAPDAFSFVLARSGAAKMLLGAANAAAPNGALRIALQEAPGIVGGTLAGASTSGPWIDALTLTPTTLVVAGSGPDAGSALVGASPNSGIDALLTGLVDADPARRIWVMQAAPLVVSFGDAGSVLSGRLQLLLP